MEPFPASIPAIVVAGIRFAASCWTYTNHSVRLAVAGSDGPGGYYPHTTPNCRAGEINPTQSVGLLIQNLWHTSNVNNQPSYSVSVYNSPAKLWALFNPYRGSSALQRDWNLKAMFPRQRRLRSGNDLYIYIAQSASLQGYRLNRGLVDGLLVA